MLRRLFPVPIRDDPELHMVGRTLPAWAWLFLLHFSLGAMATVADDLFLSGPRWHRDGSHTHGSVWPPYLTLLGWAALDGCADLVLGSNYMYPPDEA
jgi:hypothetical protein